MLKKRLIPLLLLSQGRLAKTTRFGNLQLIGYPTYQVERYNEWSVDELMFLDISRERGYDGGRDDLRVQNLRSIEEIVSAVSRKCFMPLTYGGRLKTLDDIHLALAAGADRVAINSQAVQTPELITSAARKFGSQCIVVVIDVKRTEAGPRVFTDLGAVDAGLAPVEWAKRAQELGAGEIIVQSIDRDGTYQGYDLDILEQVCAGVSVPVIAVGGAREPKHFADGIRAGASGVAAANIFHIAENADRRIRRALQDDGVLLRRI